VGKDMLDHITILVCLVLGIGPSFFDGFLIAIVDDVEGLVKLHIIVILANLAPICLALLFGAIDGVLANGEP
jgi:hypothetical protein